MLKNIFKVIQEKSTTENQQGFTLIEAVIGIAFIGIVALFMVNVDPFELIKCDLPSDTFKLFLLFLVGGFIAPVAEEVFFRGIIYGFFRKWGVLTAVIGTTVIFALAHPVGTGIPVIQAVGGIGCLARFARSARC